MHEGAWSSRLGVPGVPAQAELVMASATSRCRRSRAPGCTSCTCQLRDTSRGGGGKSRAQLPVTVEVTPHHLVLTDAKLEGYDADFKVNPPLRPAHDVDALRRGCATGVVDAIATDHAPHPPEAKDLPLAEAPSGMLGLETALAVALGSPLDATRTVALGRRASDVIRLMSWGPARIAGIASIRAATRGDRSPRGRRPICV